MKSFNRARIIYKSEEEACLAKDNLHGYWFEENQLGVYFTQVSAIVFPLNPKGVILKSYVFCIFTLQVPHISQTSQSTLQPPPPVKQFLISPPASPPVDWTPVTESSPVINHDLVAAIAKLKPDEPYEAHPPSGAHPSIMVHWCHDEETENKKDRPLQYLPREVAQTRKPDTKANQ